MSQKAPHAPGQEPETHWPPHQLSSSSQPSHQPADKLCTDQRASDRGRNPFHRAQGSEMLFARQGWGADSSRRSGCSTAPGAAGQQEEEASQTLLAPSAAGRHGLAAGVQHSCFSFVFSFGWLCSYFPHENTAPRFVPHPKQLHIPCAALSHCCRLSHCAQLVLEGSRGVQILSAGAERLLNRTSPTLLPTTGSTSPSSGSVDFRFLQQSDGLGCFL